MNMLFDENGFGLWPEAIAAAQCDVIADRVSPCPASVGSRCLLDQAWCAELAAQLRVGKQLASILPPDHVAVQCTYFEKSRDRNWLVPVHQDLSIPVAQRVESPGLRGWSQKEGSWFVQAPVDLLEQLVAVRLHLDACTDEDGPLQVLPGTHRVGVIAPEAAVRLRETVLSASCQSNQGGIMVMRPLLLHFSSKSVGAGRRRVLHFVFGPRGPGYGLRWRQTA